MKVPQEARPESQSRRRIRIRFVGAEGPYQSVTTQGYRVSNGINALNQPNISSEVVQIPRKTFSSGLLRPLRAWTWRRLVDDVEILVIIKSSTFQGFEANNAALRQLCHERNVVLVSSPADGPGSRAGDIRDPFSEEIADFVLSTSGPQHEYLCKHRDPSTVFLAGVATRASYDASITVRDQVRTVIWENPPHLDPYFNPNIVALSKEEYADFENAIRSFCESRGVRLLTFGYWRDNQSDEDWQKLMLGADIAIECKGLNRRYTEYQLQKPATKLQNYLSLGLPVVCDPVPGYEAIGKAAKVLFADTLDEWTKCLSMLFESRELRAEMSLAALTAAAPVSVASVARFHVEAFEQMLESRTATG